MGDCIKVRKASSVDVAGYYEITGPPGGSDARAVHTDPVPHETFVDVVSSALTYYGRTHKLGADSSEQVFQIWRVTISGGITHAVYASNNSNFVHAWVARGTLFAGAGLTNTRSLAFNGVDEYLNGGDIYQYDNADQWSLSVWIKVNNFSAQRCIYSKTFGGSVFGWGLYYDASANLFLQMRASAQLRSHTGSITMSALTWHHVAMTYNGGQNINGIRLYVDGVVDTTPASGTVTNTLLGGADALWGRRATAFHHSGNMDEPAIFDRQLAASEIMDIYNSGVPEDLADEAFAGNLANYYRMETDTDPTIGDQAGTDNLTMVNMSDASFETDVP